MRLVIFISIVALTYCDKLDNTYLPPSNARTSGGLGNFLQTPTFSRGQNQRSNQNFRSDSGTTDFVNDAVIVDSPISNNLDTSGFQRVDNTQTSLEGSAGILRQDSTNDGETYSYTYETENGIFAEESGVATNGVEAQGEFSYTGDDGQIYTVTYTADQNGFVPRGDHLPTPPPVPEEILKALEQNARDEQAGIFDDGSYDARKYAGPDDGSNSLQYNNGNNNNDYNQNNYNAQSNAYLPPDSGKTNQRFGNSQRENFDSRRRSTGSSSKNGY